VTDHRRALPSVSALLECAALRPLAVSTARARVTDAVRASIARVRDGSLNMPPDLEGWAASVACDISASERLSLRAAINATGVVLHTNLGRAPLAQAALDAVAATAAGFSTLEYDASTGTRGSRYTHCAALLRELTGAEDALVVNNGAAALVLALDTVAAGREAIISRGELVEIGGSFRIHEIVERSGVTLREVGASISPTTCARSGRRPARCSRCIARTSPCRALSPTSRSASCVRWRGDAGALSGSRPRPA
jgi:L-seryl-tRNA(Ser) seleniumtransferase